MGLGKIRMADCFFLIWIINYASHRVKHNFNNGLFYGLNCSGPRKGSIAKKTKSAINFIVSYTSDGAIWKSDGRCGIDAYAAMLK